MQISQIYQAPRFLINPECAPRPLWAPGLHELITGHGNFGCLNSLWLGIGWNLLTVPWRIASEVLWPLFNFRLSYALKGLLTLPLSVYALALNGLHGDVLGLRMTLAESLDHVVVTRDQAQCLIDAGCNDTVIDMERTDLEALFAAQK